MSSEVMSKEEESNVPVSKEAGVDASKEANVPVSEEAGVDASEESNVPVSKEAGVAASEEANVPVSDNKEKKQICSKCGAVNSDKEVICERKPDAPSVMPFKDELIAATKEFAVGCYRDSSPLLTIICILGVVVLFKGISGMSFEGVSYLNFSASDFQKVSFSVLSEEMTRLYAVIVSFWVFLVFVFPVPLFIKGSRTIFRASVSTAFVPALVSTIALIIIGFQIHLGSIESSDEVNDTLALLGYLALVNWFSTLLVAIVSVHSILSGDRKMVGVICISGAAWLFVFIVLCYWLGIEHAVERFYVVSGVSVVLAFLIRILTGRETVGSKKETFLFFLVYAVPTSCVVWLIDLHGIAEIWEYVKLKTEGMLGQG
ncbi:hypothetical protein DZF79_02920 [Vibrio parahaemolyticus]|nr:hypothetical protein [Vibrio parahaemolyticus]